MIEFQDVINFWFEELTPQDHFKKNNDLDLKIKTKFGSTLQSALKGELFSWRKTPDGRLAEIIVLDQFSRNIFRGLPQSFAADPLALVLSQEAVSLEVDKKIEIRKRSFFYMPYMHSESKVIHQSSLSLFSQAGLEDTLNFELRHKEIVDRFGRYPHRNEILGRVSTPEELDFLKSPGSSF